MILNDYESDHKTLLCSSNKPTMEIQRLRTLAAEIFKTLNEIKENIKFWLGPKCRCKVCMNM